MKITPSTDLSTLLSSKNPFPPQKSPDRAKNPIRPAARRNPVRTPKKSGPPTPLLRWKFDDERYSGNAAADKSPEGSHRQRREKLAAVVSSRKLAATVWRLQVAESGGHEAEQQQRRRRRRRRRESGGGDRLGFKPEVGQGGDLLTCHHVSRECGSEAKDPVRSPCSVNGPINGYLCERQSAFHYSNYAMEGATKWDPICSKASNDNPDDPNLHNQKGNTSSMISALEEELEQARAHIEELETDRRSSKKKVEHFLKKLSEERATWRTREHEKVRAIIDDVKTDLTRERKNRQRVEIVNSKLVNELTEAKLAAKRYMQEYEKERKTRELIEDVCDELAKEIGEDKAEVDKLKKECMKIRDEVEDERKMLQMAEVWREERVQMKLIDAKVALDQKYSQMCQLIAELDKFLRSKGASLDVNEVNEAEMVRRASASVNIRDIKEFTYEPSNCDDVFAVVEEMAMAKSNAREIEPRVVTVSPEINNQSKGCREPISSSQNGDVDDDGSGWETVSQVDDQGSSYSRQGSTVSVNNMCRDSYISGSCTEWEEEHVGGETPVTEISEVFSVQSKSVKKVKSITRLWGRSCPNSGDNCTTISVDGRLSSNGRVSNGTVVSPDRGSGNGISPSDTVGWSPPDLGDPHINRGLKGCIEWPRGAQKQSLKHKLREARLESQKIQLKHVLKQKI